MLVAVKHTPNANLRKLTECYDSTMNSDFELSMFRLVLTSSDKP